VHRCSSQDRQPSGTPQALRDDLKRSDDVEFIKQLQSVVVWSDSSSEGVTPLAVCSTIIADVFKFLWSFSDAPSLEEALRRLPESLRLVQDLADRRTVQIPALIAIHNVDLGDNDSVAIGPAILRRPTRYDKSRLLLNFTAPNDESVAVLRVDASFSICDLFYKRPITMRSSVLPNASSKSRGIRRWRSKHGCCKIRLIAHAWRLSWRLVKEMSLPRFRVGSRSSARSLT